MRHHRATGVCAFALVLAVSTLAAAGQTASTAAPSRRVIVELALPAGRHVPEGQLPGPSAISTQRRAIADAADRLVARLPRGTRSVVRRFTTVPYVVVDADDATRATLAMSPEVVRVMDDALMWPSLAQSVPLIQGDQAWGVGYDGTGTVVAIIDSGVDSTHPFLAGKVIDEACFSSTIAGTSQSACPNGASQQLGRGAAAPCSLAECIHGTHVAGIATGNGATAGVPFSGVAKGARIVAVQVFSIVTDPTSCGGAAPCAGAFDSDIIAGLEHVYAVAGSLYVVSANMSLGGATFSAPCDTEPEKPAIDNLRSIGVATVVAAGNNYSGSKLTSPACISSAISVGSTDKSNSVSFFSNVAPFMSLFAPGESINSSVPGGGYGVLSGTSMAAPHVSGAWAIMRQAAPGAGVSTILNAFRSTGLPITDNRPIFGGGAVVPRVSIFQALTSMVSVTNPVPTLTSVSPSHVQAGINGTTISLTGSGFNLFSVASWNGTPLATTARTAETLRATVPASAITGTSAQVIVTNPAPGGGTSAPAAVSIDPPVTLSVSATSVPTSTPVTVTLANGLGGQFDWLAFAPTGAPDTSYITYTYVGSGVTTRTWTVTTPATPGTYEFRYFPNNGYVADAISPPITVTVAAAPVPVVSSMSSVAAAAGGSAFALTVNGSSFTNASVVRWNGSDRATTYLGTTQLAPGSSVTVTLAGGFGGQFDWIALAAFSAPNTSYVAYTYVGSGVTTRTWTVSMPQQPGTYEFRLFLNNGFTRAATSPTVTVIVVPAPVPVASSLSPSVALAGTGGFTLTVNGSGFTAASVVDWNGSQRPTTVVSGAQLQAAINPADIAAVGTAQVTVFTPAPGGGTSAPLTFTIETAPTLSVSTTTAAPGASVTVTLTGGLGGASDWIALAATSAPNTSYIAYTYVGSAVATRTWTVTMPQQTGAYEFRLFLNNGFTRAATSPTVTVQ